MDTTHTDTPRTLTARSRGWLGQMVGLPRIFIAWLKHKRHICAHDGCWQKGRECRIPNIDAGTDDTLYFCWDHAHDVGFCPSCGDFWGGVESFDFPKTGLCENCDSELRHDLGEYDDDEEW